MNETSSRSWSRLGLGTGTLASLGRAASLGQVVSLMSKMSEVGVNVIDTSSSYGSGACERLIGHAMRKSGHRFHIITKAGFRIVDFPPPFGALAQVGKKFLHATGPHQNFKPSHIIESLNASLRRLGVAQIDAFLLHNPPLAAVANEELQTAMADAVRSGKALAVGVSSPSEDVLREATRHRMFSVVQTPADPMSLPRLMPLWTGRDDLTVIGNHIFNPATLSRFGGNREEVMKLGCTLLPQNGVMLCGTRNPAHLEQSAAWASQPYDREQALTMIAKTGMP